jgi:hypothetical protein
MPYIRATRIFLAILHREEGEEVRLVTARDITSRSWHTFRYAINMGYIYLFNDMLDGDAAAATPTFRFISVTYVGAETSGRQVKS